MEQSKHAQTTVQFRLSPSAGNVMSAIDNPHQTPLSTSPYKTLNIEMRSLRGSIPAAARQAWSRFRRG